ncbi:chondroitin AC/alginate lyase [Aspergillus pseudoustus]|uniref:Chondroitin AC/alginate lyase n=1 Tax=Aspergillus pseudoustus TaxID=1810923 RepID=A0ABR4JU89_9EURO
MKAPRFLTVALLPIVGCNALVHPGLLHTNADFTRIRSYVKAKTDPWYTGWEKLAAHANADYTPGAAAVVCRGASWCNPENYPVLYRDIAAAYANAIYWQVTGDTAYGDAAAAILDAWSGTLTTVTGSSDKYLAAGLYGYQLANAGEVLRGYGGWSGLDSLIDMMQAVFLPMNSDFLVNHNGAVIDHYWANWDLCNIASLHAIGVLADNQTAINQAVNYFKSGVGMGALNNAIWTIHTEDTSGKHLGQVQEAGRDQGHSLLDIALLGVIGQQAYNQGEDLFALEDNQILAGAEYVFKYNTGHDVPFTTYSNSQGTATSISSSGRGGIRPIAELIYAHYNGVRGLNVSWTGEYRDVVVEDGNGAEGGGGDYGSTSGGYDQLGFGTLLFRLDD